MNSYQRIVCPDCQNIHDCCTTCRGRGYLTVDATTHKPVTWTQCPECHDRFDTCSTCGGIGRVPLAA